MNANHHIVWIGWLESHLLKYIVSSAIAWGRVLLLLRCFSMEFLILLPQLASHFVVAGVALQ